MVGSLLNSAAAAGTVAVILGVSSAFVALVAAFGDFRAQRRRYQRDRRHQLDERLYADRPTKVFYAIAELLVVRTRRRRRWARECERVRQLSALRASNAEAFQDGVFAARAWLRTVGELSRRAKRERVVLRPFLQTYHLGLIREGALARPFLAWLAAAGELERHELAQARAGLALVRLAEVYNSVAKQQRDPVFFHKTEFGPKLGPILPAPNRAARALGDVLDRPWKGFRVRGLWIGLAALRLRSLSRHAGLRPLR